MSDDTLTLPLDAMAIRRILPHRYPFLLIDRVVELAAGQTITAIKGVSQNEPFFQGHFPHYPVMPGVLQIEALAQAGAIAILAAEEYAGKIALLTRVDGFKFRRQVVPGDQLTLKVELSRLRRGFGKGHGVARVDGEVTAEGEIGFAVVEDQ